MEIFELIKQYTSNYE